MAYQADEITILKNNEFMLLLAAAGIDSWYGIDIGEATKLESDREFNKTLAVLYRKNIIDWDNEKAILSGPYRHMMSVLKNSAVCVTIRSETRPGYVQGCYFYDEDVVTVDRRTASSDEIELSLHRYQDWLRSLTDDGIIPETSELSGIDEMADVEPEPVSSFELRSMPEGDLNETAEIISKGLYGLLERTVKGKTDTEYFTEEAFINMMRDWIGGIA